MLSCDTYMISKASKEISYEDIVISSGLSNALYKIPFAGEYIFALTSRGITKPADIFKNLNIKYDILKAQELPLEAENDYRRILINVPSMLIDRADTLNPRAIMPALAYSVYSLESIIGNELHIYTLTGETAEDVLKKRITFDQYDRIKRVQMKPRGEPITIIKIADATSNAKHNIELNLVMNLTESLTTMDNKFDDIIFYSGESSYEELKKILINFDSYNKTIRTLLYGSICGGSPFFHRREFALALHETQRTDRKTINLLIKSGNYWRALSRIVYRNLSESTYIDPQKVSEHIEKLREIDMNALSHLYNYYS